MVMVEEKKKREKRPRRTHRRSYLLIGLLAAAAMSVPVPLMFAAPAYRRDAMIDMLIIGYMLCVAIFIAHRLILMALSALAQSDPTPEGIFYDEADLIYDDDVYIEYEPDDRL